MKILRTIIVAMLIPWVLTACSTLTTPQQGNPAINDIQAALNDGVNANQQISDKKNVVPADISDALLPSLTVDNPAETQPNEKRFDISVQNIPAQAFFTGLVKGTDYNMVVSPKITGTITLQLSKVTIDEALQAVHDNYGYEYKRTSYGYQIFPAGLETRVFTVNYLDMIRTGETDTQVSSGQISQQVGTQTSGTTTGGTSTAASGGSSLATEPASQVKTKTSSDFWAKLTSTLEMLIGDKDGREVVTNPAAGIVIVRAYPNELREVAQYLDELQSTMTRQVILEAKILEIALSADYQAGVDWTILGASQTSTTQNLDGDNLLTFKNIFALNAHFGNAFQTVINLISTQGNVQVLSSPRIATLNNQKAIIKVGDDQFFITNVTSNTVLAGASTQSTQGVNLTPFFSGIALDVTPEISEKGDVILHIHPLVSEVKQKDLSYTINGQAQSLPLATSQIRETDNIVVAKNGQVIVIAGLMKNNTKEHMAETPFLSKAPVVGPLFRRTNQASTKSELVILLRPIVVGDNTWTKHLREASTNFQNLNRGYHFGSHPEVFGNTAEQFPKKQAPNQQIFSKDYIK